MYDDHDYAYDTAESCFTRTCDYRARYYDPSTGRFISEDPIGFEAGINFYRYVNNAPIDTVDPSGLAGGPYHPPAGVSYGCTGADDCSTIRAKMWLIQKMLQSHIGWDFTMPAPRGGTRHAEDIGNLLGALRNCREWYRKKGCTECQKAGQPTPEGQQAMQNLLIGVGAVAAGGAIAAFPAAAPLIPLLKPVFQH